jgi:hypothetical protein
MGRGLSNLQRWILSEARRRGWLEYDEIYQGYFGWRRTGPYWPNELRQTFSPRDIGEGEYNRVMATVSRSVRRLEERGLVRLTGDYLGQLELTGAGREVDLEYRTGK